MVLRSCLDDKIKDVVINVEDNMEKIWKRLDEKFGDLSKLADIVVNDIKRLKCIREGDNKGIISLVDIIERGYRDLELLGLEKEISNTGTVSLIEEKLPRDIRREWSKEVNKRGSSVDIRNKFPALLQFLQDQRKIIEYEYSELRYSTNEINKQRIHMFNEEAKIYNTDFPLHEETECGYLRCQDSTYQQVLHMSNNNFQRCIVHNNSSRHTTKDCNQFKAMDIKTRLQLVKDRRGCFSCLKSGHRAAECRFRKICSFPGCGRYHHDLLHEDDTVCTGPTERPVNEPKHVNLLNSTNSDCQDRLDNCILPMMNIYCKGKFINVLWDTGATISLITNKVARELGLTKGAQRTLTVIKVGGTVEEIESSSYMVPLVDKRSKKVHIHRVDTISSNINNVDISNTINLFNNLHKEEILNPQGSVDMLIGMNYASIQPQREQTIDNLALYGNRFGKCIVGSHHKLEGQNIAKVYLSQIKSEQTSVLERFFTIEQMGVSCIPQCGSCRCGKCPTGSKDYTIKEEHELRMVLYTKVTIG